MSLSNSPGETKWLQMLAIVNKSHKKNRIDSKKQFQQLVLKRFIAENSVVFLLQYIGLTLSAFGLNASPLWLAAGTSCAFIFMRGISILPGIGLGTCCAYYLAQSGLIIAITAGSLYALQAFLLLRISYRFISPTLIFYEQSLLIKYFICTSIISAITSLALTFLHHHTLSLAIGIQNWLGDFTGIIVFSFALITLDAFFTQFDDLKKQNKWRLMLSIAAIIIPFFLFIFTTNPFTITITALMLLISVAINSWQYGWCAAVISIFFIGFGLDLSAYIETPLFAHPPHYTLIYLQCFLLIAAFLSLWISIQKRLFTLKT